MSQKPALRVVIEHGGELKRLFSVRERTNGDLNVTIHVNEFLAFQEDGSTKTMKECRYSIHVTPKDPSGNTIKGTTEYSDGTKQLRHLFTTAIAQGHVQPIFARSVIHPRFLRAFTGEGKGSLLPLPAVYDPERWTMYYALWLCSPEVGMTNPLDGPHPFLRWSFREFTIFAPFCFVPMPSGPHSKIWEAGTTTAEHRSNRHAELNCRVGPAEGATPRSAAGGSVWLFNGLIDRPYGVGLRGDASPDIGMYTPRFFPWPSAAPLSYEQARQQFLSSLPTQ